jgi:5'-nucleotidase
MGNPNRLIVRAGALVALTLLLPLGACSSDGGGDDAATTTTEAAAEETTTTEAPTEPLQILVSNDDGYDAEGIDALVEGLLTLDDVELTVVAPLTQQSGQGGKSTLGELNVSEVATAGGFEATAVEGFPADSIRVALDEQEVEADLVITGINEGQNLGPLVDLSGTVGAARAAVARGIPALATSQGSGEAFDYEAAVPFILEWVEEHRAALLAGEATVEVVSMNIPSCDEGEIKGLAEVEADLDGDPSQALVAQDCTTELAAEDASGDVEAFNNGWVTLSVVPDEPATPAEVVEAS